MPLEVPNLDDRRWADLVEDAQALIPRLAPRWTDHNVHDPGITFIELFAWLAEMQIYQLNRVGEKHREVFGRLAGVRRRLRTPARVDVLAIGDLTVRVPLPIETQLTPLEGDEIVFETTAEVVLTRSRLLRVVVDDGSGPVDQTAANEKFGIAFLAFGEQARAGAELRLGFDRFYPDEEQTIRLAVDVFTADLGARCGPDLPVPANGGENGAGVQPVDLAWEYLGPGEQWLPLPLISDGTYALSQSGAVTLSLPANAELQRQRVWIRSRILRGYYDIEPRLRHIGVNGLPCAQRETVRNELLGRGNGRPDQSFELAKGPILVPESASPVQIAVENELWQPVTSFDGAGPVSKQYVFDVDSRRVLFGNGLNGKVPMPGQDIRARWYQTKETVRDELLGRGNGRPDQSFELAKGPILVPERGSPVLIEVENELWDPVTSFDDAGPLSKRYVFDVDSRRVLFGNGLNGQVPMPGQDIRARWYQTSVGRSGNVAKDLPWKLRTAIAPGVTLTNPEPATGGSDPESLNDLELRARALLNRPHRAVTLSDIERLALGTPNVYVARAATIPDCPTPERITVVAVPKIRPGRKGPPAPPSEAFLTAVRQHLQQRRLLCDNLRVVGPMYLEVRVSARLRLAKGAGPAAVIERARQALDRFLAGEDLDALSEQALGAGALQSPCLTRWPFGRSVFPSEIYAVLDGVAGVDAISSLALSANRGSTSIAPDSTGAIPVPRIGLVFPSPHDLTVESDVRRNG